jgi:hypothetical protein
MGQNQLYSGEKNTPFKCTSSALRSCRVFYVKLLGSQHTSKHFIELRCDLECSEILASFSLKGFQNLRALEFNSLDLDVNERVLRFWQLSKRNSPRFFNTLIKFTAFLFG